jgi:hypothetical protein
MEINDDDDENRSQSLIRKSKKNNNFIHFTMIVYLQQNKMWATNLRYALTDLRLAGWSAEGDSTGQPHLAHLLPMGSPSSAVHRILHEIQTSILHEIPYLQSSIIHEILHLQT